MDDDALRDAFTAEVLALGEDREPFTIQTTKVQAWILVGQLQLALRHPANVGPTAVAAREIVQRILALVATTPALRTVAERGWLATPDQPPTDETWAANTLAQVLDHLRGHAQAGCSSCGNWVRGHGGSVAR